MQQIVILLVINSPSTCFGRLYAHRQEVRLRFHYVHTACQPTLQHHNSYNRTENDSENAVWPPDDGRKGARNMLRDYWLPIKSLIVASSWSHLYLLIKDARSFEYKNFRKISWKSLRWELTRSVQTDRRTDMTKPTVLFAVVLKALKKTILILTIQIFLSYSSVYPSIFLSIPSLYGLWIKRW